MASKTANAIETEARVQLRKELQAFARKVPDTILNGDPVEVNRLRKQIVEGLKKDMSLIVKTFDEALKTAKTGVMGSDFLKEVEPIIKPGRGRPRKEVVFDPDMDF